MTGKGTPRRTREQGCTAPEWPSLVPLDGSWSWGMGAANSLHQGHLSGCSPISPHVPNPHPSGTGTFFWALGATGFSSPANKALTSSATGTPLACSFCTCLTSCRMQDA